MSKYWLLKTEPESFSIQDLAKSPKQTTCWDGVRNYQARNYLRDEMKIGDLVACGISHPCTTFDKWRLLPMVDDQYNITAGVHTFF